MQILRLKTENLMMLAAATSALGGLSSASYAQNLNKSDNTLLGLSSFSNSDQYRRQKLLADIGLAEQPTIFSLLPGKKFEFSFGKQTLFSLTENKYSFSFNSKNFNAGIDKLNFKGKSSLNQLALNSNYSFGASSLAFAGFSISDDKSNINQQNFSFSSGSAFSLKAERLSVDKDFNRIADLPNATPEEKRKLEQEKGFDRTGIAASFNPSKSLSFTTDRFTSDSKDSGVIRSGYRDFGSLSFGVNSRLSFLNEGSSISNDGNSLDKRSHQQFAFGMNASNLSISAMQDTQSIATPGNNTKVSSTSFSLNHNGKLPVKASFENKSTSINAFSENSRLTDIQFQPSKSVSIRTRLHDINRNQGESSSLSLIDWSAGLTNKINFSGYLSNFKSDSGNDLAISNFRLQGELAKGYKFSALQETQNGQRFGIRNIYDLTLNSPQITSVKPFTNLSFSARNFKSQVNGQEESHITSLTLAAQTSSLKINAEHLDMMTQNGYQKTEQGITVSTIPKPGDTVSGSIQYKTREHSLDGNSVDNIPARSVNASVDIQTGAQSRIQAKYSLRPENEKQQPLPKSDFQIGFQQSTKDLRFDATIGQSYDYIQDVRATRFQFGASGKLDDDTRFSGMLGAAFEERTDQDRFTPLMSLNLERNISADDKINLTTAYTEAGWQLKLEAIKKF